MPSPPDHLGTPEAPETKPPGTAEPWLPARRTLPALRQAVQECRGCDLYKEATQAIFGEGKKSARIMLVGEAPGDREDQEGRPFVGPAGRLLDQALEAAEIPRSQVYLTNAVKHFKFTLRGKRRLHAKPTARQIKACRPWLEAELAQVRPRVLVALGATAAGALFGASFRLTAQRGQPVETALAPWALATLHPSALLRIPEEEGRRRAWEAYLDDFALIAQAYRRLAAEAD